MINYILYLWRKIKPEVLRPEVWTRIRMPGFWEENGFGGVALGLPDVQGGGRAALPICLFLILST